MSWHNPQVQQVRWLDALNTGDVEIPGHAVVWVNSAGPASDYGITLPTDPYVLEVYQFAAEDATVNYSIEVAATYYGVSCEIQEQYHDVMGYFAVNGPVPIPPGRAGVVTCDPPFVALCDSQSIPLVPIAGEWHLTHARASDPACGSGWVFAEWFRVLRDMRPAEAGSRPMLVDIDSKHFVAANADGSFP